MNNLFTVLERPSIEIRTVLERIMEPCHMPSLKTWSMTTSSTHTKDWLNSRNSPELPATFERVQATVLFADIVGSTELLVTIGDYDWVRLLKGYYALALEQIVLFEGQLLSTSGDGFHACFEDAERAARCAHALRVCMNSLGLSLRIGLHLGECLKVEGLLTGLTLHIGARIAAAADANEVLVSNSVRAHLDGLPLKFVDRGSRHLKGLPGAWRLFNYECDHQPC